MLLKYIMFIFPFLSGVYLYPTKNTNNYGPYRLSIEEFVTCRGPKSINLTTVTVDTQGTSVAINYTFLNDVKISEIRSNIFHVKGDKTELIYNIRTNEPCKHFMFSHLFKQYLKADDCIVKKGFYITKSDFVDLLENLWGPTFFYEKFMFKSSLLSKTGNIACFFATVTVNKK